MTPSVKIVIDFKGLAEMRELFKKAPDIMSDQLQKAINSALPEVLSKTRARTPVITGRLRGGIEAKYATISNLTGFIRSTVEYGPKVHERKPFMEWGAEDSRSAVIERFEQAISNVKNYLGKN